MTENSNDLDRVVRKALAAPLLGTKWANDVLRLLDRFTPIVVELIEAQRAPLIAARDAAMDGRMCQCGTRWSEARKAALLEAADAMNSDLLAPDALIATRRWLRARAEESL